MGFWDGFKDWMLAVGNPREWERQNARRRAAEDAEAGILSPTIRAQLLDWSERLGEDRVNDGIKMRFNYNEDYTDIYFGGVGGPDKDGHGHIRVDIYGNETIVREPFVEGTDFGRREATLLDDRTPDRRPGL